MRFLQEFLNNYFRNLINSPNNNKFGWNQIEKWHFWWFQNSKSQILFEILNLKKEKGKIPNPKSETQLWKLIQNPEFQF